jgi:hypothetical protein
VGRPILAAAGFSRLPVLPSPLGDESSKPPRLSGVPASFPAVLIQLFL